MAEVMSKAAYLRLLEETSAAGGFPSARLAVDAAEKARVMSSVFCLYRSPDGKKCAVGLVIPDEAYDPAMETKRVLASEVAGAVRGRVEGFDPANLGRVQTVHDTLAKDCLLNRTPWPHAEFVRRLRDLPAFRGVDPS